MKVAIVGCKGSGKTVLMSVLGVKYEKPDKNGIFLNPKDKQTLHICNENVGCMQDEAKWPLATSPDATECLQWEIMRKVADDPCDTIADLCFLDFAGEIYTGGWGGDNIKNLSAEAQRSLAQLKSHVKEADVLIVLVNLRDIINGQRGDASTDSMEWAARTVFSYVYNEAKPSKVALVFTQSDMYENIIAERGSLQNVLKEYMPNIDVRFGNRLALFSVAAVATTEPAPDGGSPLPARNFESKGLEELMLWIADYCSASCKREVERIKQRKRTGRKIGVLVLLLWFLYVVILLFCEHKEHKKNTYEAIEERSLESVERCGRCVEGRVACREECRFMKLDQRHRKEWFPHCVVCQNYAVGTHGVWVRRCTECDGKGNYVGLFGVEECLCRIYFENAVMPCTWCGGLGMFCGDCKREMR